MAYPTVSAPYGLVPINLIGGQVYAGQVRHIPITSASGTDIFFGDVVALNTTGTLTKVAGTSTAKVVGVFLGVTYTSPVTKQKLFTQYYDAPITATDIAAYVQDDPDQLYKVAVVSSGTTISGVTRAAVGDNTALVQNPGSTTTGNSGVAVSVTTSTDGTLPIRVIDVVPETANAAGSYTEVIVKFNFGTHQYNVADGSTVSA
jgi:hypothetical protein